MTLGRYEVVKHLARGGMAEVLLARATGIEGFERHVVIKRIRAEQARDQGHVQMFLEEARLAASLHHHNIVQVHDIGEEQGEYFFVMEYVHGEDVRRLLTEVGRRGERPPLEHVLAIVTAAAAGLHHAHEQCGPDRVPLGIVHRDVSPENILVGYDGGVKVADFGIAKAAHRTLKTESGVRKGKVAYMAPEQCVGLPVDRRCDVFALGIVLYESLTVRRLFKDDNDFLTMTAIVQGKIPLPSTLWPAIPPELEAIVMKALSRSPDNRYATADQMRLALEGFAARVGLHTSTTTLADYMKAQFGRPLEPWLAEDDEPEIELRIGGDDPGSGFVAVPKDAIRTLAVPRVVSTPVPRLPVPCGTAISGVSRPSVESLPLGFEVLRLPASSARVVLPRPAGRRWRRLGACVGSAVLVVAAVGLGTGGGGMPAFRPAALSQRALPPAPSELAPVAVVPRALALAPRGPPPIAVVPSALPPAPSKPPPVVVPTPAAAARGNGAETPAPPAPGPSQPGRRHHPTPRPETPKKHWDRHALFPR